MSDKEFKFLVDILNDDELRQLSGYVKIKLESHLEGKQVAIENMKTQLANSTANAEKKTFAVDRELQNTKSKLQMSEDFVEKLKNQLKEGEEALQKSRHEYYELLECKDSLTYELNGLKEKTKRFADEKMDLTELLDRRQEEIQSLQNELKTICSKLKTNSEGRLETTVKAEELEMKMISVQHQELRMSQERQLYQKQVQYLNEELNAKVNELLTLRRDRTIQIFELQSNLEQKTEENTKYLEEIKHLKQIIDKKDRHIESLAQRMCEMQHFSQQLEEDFKNEITAQNSLIDLHKEANNDLKKRNESLIDTIEEMQKILQIAKEAHNDLESTFNNSQIQYTEQLNESIEKNSLLTKELEELKETVANTSRDNLEFEFERQYPLAANTKKLLGKNMSFTQIFNELVAKQQELDDQKSENSVLKEHLQHLTSEAEENAPLLHRKIHEHQRALQNIVELQNQLSSLMTEREQWLQEKDTLLRISKQYEREIKRFENENKDLSKQIRALIKSVQEARGFTVSDGQDSSISSSDSFRGVPQDLITFKDIEELQTRNQELMNALRENNEKLKNLENEKNDQQMVSIRKDLDEAVSQLENLRAERRQQTELVEALIQQRDAYKMLSSHTNPEANQSQKSSIALNTSITSMTSGGAEEQNKLKSDFEELKKEYERYREESGNKINSLTETNEKLRQNLSELKIESAKISSELVFTQERLQMFKTNCEQFQRENALLRERNTILNENSKKQEQSLILMRQDLLSLNEKTNRFEMNVESLKSERDLYRNNEIKLLQEKELMIRNQENQNKLINTLQSVQNNLNQMESDSIRNLKTQNSKLEKEVSYLRVKLEKDSERHSEATTIWEKHTQELQNRLDNEIEKFMKTHKELTEFQTKAKNLENELNSIKTGVNQLNQESGGSTEADRALQSQLIVIREQYSEAQNEIKLLREKLSNAQKASESLRSINSTLEEKLNEHRLTTEEIQERANSIINEKENTIKSLAKELAEIKERYQRLNAEKNSLESDHKSSSQQYLERINKLTNSLIEANSSAEKAVLNEQRALEDKENQMAIALEAQANYERELLQHSRDAQIINTLRKQLEIYQNKVFEAESAAHKAQEQLTQSHQLWEGERKTIAENINKFKDKCNDLERVNDTLNQQLELLNNKIIALQNNSNLPLLSKEEEVENTNRLLDVIKFLRKEKEVIQTQLTALESEDSRNNLVIDNLKKELTHIQNELREEKLNSENIMSNVSQHNEMVKKIEMINILSDSNGLLRTEKANLETKCKELELQLKQIDSQKLSKDIEELNLKIETKNAENLALRQELTHWQKRTNSLTEQLNKTSPEDLRRLNEEKTKLQQQMTTSSQELNKLNHELESQKNTRKALDSQIQTIKNNLEVKTTEAKKLSEELNTLKTENQMNQNTIIQLRKVARKYKMQFDELKAQFDKINENKDTSVGTASPSTSDVQSTELAQKVDELNSKIKEMDQQIIKTNSDLIQVTEEREAAKAQAIEKEEKAKKIAHQAKQRLAAISTEKSNILKEKESLEKSIEDLKEKIKNMEQHSEENSLRMASIKSQYEAKVNRHQKELSEALKQIENLKTSQQQKSTQQQIQSTTGVSTASVQTSQTQSNPVRHSVHPQSATVQPLSAKSTPTASIRPLAVASALHRTGRNVSTRTATVATVQPTTEESTSHQSVPQATVQPTQTVAFVPPNSNLESEIIVSQSEEEMEDLMQNQQNNEMSEAMPSLSQTFSEDNSQNSVPEESTHITVTHIDTRTETSEPSTSIRIDRNRDIVLKRGRTSSDEVSDPLNDPKKQRIEIETNRAVETIQRQSIERSADSTAPQTADNVDDDDVIIIESDSEEEEEQREDINDNEDNVDEEEDEEDEEEEEEYDNEDNEDNVEEGEEIYGEENEEYNEEEEEEEGAEEQELMSRNYEEEQDNSVDPNDAEEIEAVGGDTDGIPEINVTEETHERQQSMLTEEQTVERTEQNVSSFPTTSGVTSSTESNPFIQFPTPIQRPGFSTAGRQSLYWSHPQQSSNYDEGDGIVPSTPTLIVPRRGESFADALNSPRVPQSNFIFNSSIPESTPLSQLATETTLGVDDTRMDLSQFDDNNNGRSVPTTPATSPANNAVHSTVQSIDVDNDSNQNYGIDPNVTENIPTEFETDSSNIETETADNSNKSANTSADEGMAQRVDNKDESNEENKSEENPIQSESIPTSTSAQNIGPRQMARRGRAFGTTQRGPLQRRPILAPTSEGSGGISPNRQPTPANVPQNPPQIPGPQQTSRTIRLRNAAFATRGNFRGRPSRGPRGGGYHYNN